jgi:hypothetical protein
VAGDPGLELQLVAIGHLALGRYNDKTPSRRVGFGAYFAISIAVPTKPSYSGSFLPQCDAARALAQAHRDRLGSLMLHRMLLARAKT